MIVGTAVIRVAIPGCRSLKEKRRHIRGLVNRVRSRYSVACAEVDEHDVWDRAVLGVACVSTASSHAAQIIQSVVSLVDGTRPLVLMDFTVEVL